MKINKKCDEWIIFEWKYTVLESNEWMNNEWWWLSHSFSSLHVPSPGRNFPGHGTHRYSPHRQDATCTWLGLLLGGCNFKASGI